MGRQGELLQLAADYDGARRAFERMADNTRGDLHVEALMHLADVSRGEGRLLAAMYAYEALLVDAEGGPHQDQAHLALAELHSLVGEADRAAELYRAVRENSDHQGEAYRTASAGLKALGRGVSDTFAPDDESGVSDDEDDDDEGWESAFENDDFFDDDDDDGSDDGTEDGDLE